MSFLDRTMPYERFGTKDIAKATNIDEALKLAGMDWKVEARDMFDANGMRIPGYVANVRRSDNEVLGVVGQNYHIVQNEEAFRFVDSLAGNGFEFDRAGQFRNGKSIWMMGHLPESKILGDKIDNNLVIVNSHDGSSGVKVMITPVRVACANMLNVALAKANRVWNVKHTRHIATRMDEAMLTLGLATKYMRELEKEADVLAVKKITDKQINDIFDIMFPVDVNKDSERKIKNITIFRKNFFQCYDEADLANFKGTAWGAINAMADLVDHSAPNRNTSDYYSNHWNKLLNGHEKFDTFCKMIRA